MATDSRIGLELAGYRIESEIGRGGMSVVYLAEHLRLHRRVALKLISSDLATEASFRERFLRESELAASLEHPNIVPIYDAGEAEGILYIAMRYIQGADLKKLIRNEGALEVGRAVSIVSQAASALDAAHAMGLVHRDVKPGNILLAPAQDGGDHVYLSDFGLTKRTSSDSGITATGQFVGTLDYAAPEQFEGKPLDARTDVYSLGCVLYECLTGEPPYSPAQWANNQAALVYSHLMRPPPRPTERRPELPPALDDVGAKGMAKAPDDRFATAGALATAARAAAPVEIHTGSSQPVESEPRPMAPSPEATPRRAPIWKEPRARIAAVVVAVLVVVPIVALALNGRSKSPSGPPNPSTTVATSRSNSLWRIDPDTGRVVGTIPLGGQPTGVAIGEGSIWVGNLTEGSVSRIDPITNKAVSIKVGKGPWGIAIAGGAAWVVLNQDKAVVSIDPNTNRVGNPIRLAEPGNGITSAGGYVWVTDDDHLYKIDPNTQGIVKAIPFGSKPIALAGESAWFNYGRVDLRTERETDFVFNANTGRCPGPPFNDVVATEDAVWVLGCTQYGRGPAQVYRIDLATGRAGPPISIENGGGWLAAAANDLWVLGGNGSISRIDLHDNSVHPFAQAGRAPAGFAVGAGALWVAVDLA